MPHLRSELRSKARLREAKLMWDDMVEHWKAGTGPKPSLYRMMWRMNRTWCIWGLLLGVLQGVLNNAGKPILLNLMILAFSERQKDLNVIILLLLLGVVVLVEGWCKVVTQTILHTDLCPCKGKILSAMSAPDTKETGCSRPVNCIQLFRYGRFRRSHHIRDSGLSLFETISCENVLQAKGSTS